MLRSFTCIGVVPVADRIVLDLDGKESKSASILLVTVWELGEAAGPLLIAPLSEIYGRYPVFIVANMVFILGTMLAAVSPTTHLFIFSRFLTGFAVASNVLNPAIIGDIYAPQSRGSGMSLIMLAPLLGGAFGPAISGAIAESLGWRNILWICAGVAMICEVFFLALFRETYKVPILQRRAARLRKERSDDSLNCAWENEKVDESRSWSALRIAIKRPALVMASSGVLQILSFCGAFTFSLYYISATTFPGILREVYGYSPAMIGLSFLSFSIGASIAILVSNQFLDKMCVALGKSRGGPLRPEDRLPFLIGGLVIIPPIVALYGWAPYAEWSVWVLLLAMALTGFALIVTWVPLSSYVVDSFGLYSASALTGLLIARCLGGTLIPLAIPPLTDAIGTGYGFLVVAAVCLVLIPLPMMVMRYGSVWRQNSVYTRDV